MYLNIEKQIMPDIQTGEFVDVRTKELLLKVQLLFATALFVPFPENCFYKRHVYDITHVNMESDINMKIAIYSKSNPRNI